MVRLCEKQRKKWEIKIQGKIEVIHIYIYIEIERERERDDNFLKKRRL